MFEITAGPIFEWCLHAPIIIKQVRVDGHASTFKPYRTWKLGNTDTRMMIAVEKILSYTENFGVSEASYDQVWNTSMILFE